MSVWILQQMPKQIDPQCLKKEKKCLDQHAFRSHDAITLLGNSTLHLLLLTKLSHLQQSTIALSHLAT